MARIAAECLLDCRNELGEGPVWSVRERRLYWVDCIGRTLFGLDPVSMQRRDWRLSGNPGSLALRADGSLLIAFRTGLALFDPESGTETPLSNGPVDFATERFNDGKVDRKGRFWAGTLARNFTDPVGSLWRLGPDRRPVRMDQGFVASNGIAWSPANDRMYFCDSRPGTVYVYDFDLEAGTVSDRRVFLDMTTLAGRPDGCTVDAEGHLWVAEVDGGRVGRYAPDGRLDTALELPVKRPSSVAFGGADLDTLFVTSIRRDSLEDEPLGGALFWARPGVRGLPEPIFNG